jgi:hypothetical protein
MSRVYSFGRDGYWVTGKYMEDKGSGIIKILSWHLPRRGAEENHWIFQDSSCIGRESNKLPPE